MSLGQANHPNAISLVIKNQAGTVIGFERLNYALAEGERPKIELMTA